MTSHGRTSQVRAGTYVNAVTERTLAKGVQPRARLFTATDSAKRGLGPRGTAIDRDSRPRYSEARAGSEIHEPERSGALDDGGGDGVGAAEEVQVHPRESSSQDGHGMAI